MRPVSDAAERNKEPILTVLQQWLGHRPCRVLEVGSGTGQHAVHFSGHLKHVIWQPSDFGRYLPLLHEYVAAAQRDNLMPPIELNVDAFGAVPAMDVIFSANTLHIMGWSSVQTFLAQAGARLPVSGHLIVYGPFHVGGRPTSASNAHFDASLQAQDPRMGIRDREQVCRVADRAGLSLQRIHAMPANNQTLVFERRAR